MCVCACKVICIEIVIDNELILKDYRNGISGNPIDTKINDANLIDCCTPNETHRSIIQSSKPLTSSSSLSSSSTTTATTTKITTTTNNNTTTSTLLKLNKNPFLIGEMKHNDEFTQSPLKICLVVSPPTNKLLQVCLTK